VGPEHQVDVDPPEIGTLAVLEQIEALGPYGMDYPLPLFQGRFELGAHKPMGDGSHVRISLHRGQERYDAVWFNAAERMDSLPRSALVLYRLSRNTWRGRTRVDIHIEDVMENANGQTGR
jgi:single-stranded-DNA-specific exonuclease